jgi:hypothetical protein
MKNIPYIIAVSLSLVSLGHAAEEPEKAATHSASKIRVHDKKELEEWKTKIEKKRIKHRRWCFDCKKPFTVNDVQYSGDCAIAGKLRMVLDDDVTPGLREWGLNPKNDAMVIGRLEVIINAKWIEGKGYNKKAVWDETTGDYKIIDVKY